MPGTERIHKPMALFLKIFLILSQSLSLGYKLGYKFYPKNSFEFFFQMITFQICQVI